MENRRIFLGILILGGIIAFWGTQFSYGQAVSKGKLPDLKVVHTDHQPAGEVTAGKTIQFKVTVKNFGTGVARGL